jgi:chitinase
MAHPARSRPSPRHVAALPAAAAAALALCGACRIAGLPSAPSRPAKTVIGYYRTSTRPVLDHTGIEYRALTHIAHAFIWPDAAGRLVVPPGFLYPELNAAARATGVRMLVSVGGWGNCDGFPGTAATAENRARFVGQLIDLCRTRAYDGVDLDWEYPANETERASFSVLVEELAAALKAQSPPLLLTAAVPADSYHGRWIDYERLAGDFDFIGFMTYDYHGTWSGHAGHNAPLYRPTGDACGSLDATFAYALFRRVPLEKLLVGLAFFGRSFDCGALGQAFTVSRGWVYRDIAALPGPEWARVWDGEAQVPYLRRADGRMIITYDDPSSIGLKCQYVEDRDCAGVIIWELGSDRRDGHSELLDVVGRSFGAGPPPDGRSLPE